MRILLDGYNLALAQGTGVATYSRNLSREMSNLGHDVSVLFGQRLHYGNEAILREIAFFDDSEKRSHPIVEGVQSAMGAVLGPFGTTPRTVPLSGAVITKTFEARTQNFGRIYNSRNIFRT
ncbi:MAG: hypothetical protein P1U62_15000, partial [Alteraurantiacibacter sp. bin_em_oilr2.035]|nr:hypothetical protein [Alteraurantiacibacter sp. bin_em_oilr2.035]